MTIPFRPLLATAMKEPIFPYLASPKLDGIRCIIRDGVAYSRNLKPIPNKYIQSILGNRALSGIDGEITVGSPTAADVFKSTTSVVMAHDKETEFTFHVFDDITDPALPFEKRFDTVISRKFSLGNKLRKFLNVVPHQNIHTPDQLQEYEQTTLLLGYEGVMLRDPKGVYKFGRSTVRENILLKVKRFLDSEAIVIGFEELMHNDNAKEECELGLTKRATKQENLRPAGTLGALVVHDIESGVEFNIGTGLTAAERQTIWNHRDVYRNAMLTYKFFPVGTHEKPRHPVFVGWRDPSLIQRVA